MERPLNVIYHAPRRTMLEVVPEDLAPGLVAGERFRLERRLGGGGMGEVWAATHLLTKKVVALKFLKPSRAGDARSRARIALEARAASAVRHPNVVQVHDVGELDSGLPFLVMDLLEGETLAARLAREGRLSVAAAAEVLLPVIDAVRAAHAVGVVHRDLKPENVFLARADDGATKVLVLDFGIAKLLESAESSGPALTATGEVLGSSLYMAPEQVFGDSDLDGRVDVWSLGVILYEVLTGVRPTERASSGQVLKAITTDEIAPITRARSDVPPRLARVVMRMLARDRAARADLEEVSRALGDPHGAASPARWPLGLAIAGAVVAGLAFARRVPHEQHPGRLEAPPQRPDTTSVAAGAVSAEVGVASAAPAVSSVAAAPTNSASRRGAATPVRVDPSATASPTTPSSVVAPTSSDSVLTHDRK